MITHLLRSEAVAEFGTFVNYYACHRHPVLQMMVVHLGQAKEKRLKERGNPKTAFQKGS